MNVSPPLLKFRDPDITAKGETRAQVAFGGLETLWVNTGTPVCRSLILKLWLARQSRAALACGS